MNATFIFQSLYQIISQVITLSRIKVPVGWGLHDWSQYYKARSDNNPRYGLIIAWGILEKEAEKSFKNLPKIEGKNPAIVKNCKSFLNLSNIENSDLENAMRKRNKVAHGRNVEVLWSDVDTVVNFAYHVNQLG